MNPRETFFKALNFVKQGQFTEALPLCQQLLKLNPNEVNNLRLLGQIQHRQGRLAEARASFSRVVQLAPDYAHAYMDLGFVEQDLDHLAEAEQTLAKALSLDSKLHPARRALYAVLLAQEKFDEARKLEAVLQEREAIAGKVQSAFELFKAQEFDQMESLCQNILQQDPGNLAIARLLADYASRNLNPVRAERLFRLILQRAQENCRAWNGLARALTQQDNVDEALQCIKRSQEIDPANLDTKAVEADAHIRRYDYEAGIELYKEILQQQPDRNSIRSQLGLTLKTVGRQDEAIAQFDHCIANDESFGEAYWALSDMKTYAFTEAQMDTMSRVWQRSDLPDRDRVYLGYGLGKALEHRQQYAEAFKYYEQANQVQKTLVEYSAEANRRLTDGIIETFTPELFERLARTAEDAVTPIFVVSLPRSGSTLQEQILASHSQVEGTQELPYLTRMAAMLHRGQTPRSQQAFPAGVGELTPAQIDNMAEEYLAKADFHRREKTPFFIDKLPNNFLYIGLIALCFPHAKIINARRHPMDSCLGCYKQLWATGQHFTYDLEDLGHYYRDYDRLMQHWHQVLPGRILDVHYEQVVDDLESHVHRLLDYCGLEFEENCINFHQTQRVVKTSSSEQVRKPIYRSALAYWKNFEEELEPLKKVLGELAED